MLSAQGGRVNEDYSSAETCFGGLLRRYRLASGLSQEELAQRAGLSVRAVANMERGRTARPYRRSVWLLAEALALPDQQRAQLARASRLVTDEGLMPGPAAVKETMTVVEAEPLVIAPRQLPATVPHFVGRDDELLGLNTMLDDASDTGETVAISAIGGSAGVGKSTLAVHWAHQVASRFPDGQLYLNLRGSSSQPMAPREALARLLRDLGADPEAVPAEEEERAARYRSLAAGRRLIIVLDDACDAAHVRPLMPGTAGCAVVVTSRSSLHDLQPARLVDLSGMSDADAAALLARIVGAQRCESEPEAVRAVLAACAGLPLAIWIAAARLVARPSWSIATLASRLSDARKRLDELQTGDQAVRASFLVSYANLLSTQKGAADSPDRVFRLLGLAEGPDISLPAAAALLGAGLDRTEKVLELLVDGHLLQSVTPVRYRLHDLLRIYAAERAAADEDTVARAEATRRLLSWYLHTAVAACRMISPHRTHLALDQVDTGIAPLAFDSYSPALAWLDAEHANLISAVEEASRHGEHEIAWKLAFALWDLFNLRGRLSDWLAVHKTGLASARTLGDANGEKYMLGNLAANYVYAGLPAEALTCMRDLLAIVRAAGDATGTATALVNLGVTLTELGQADEATAALEEALGLFRAAGQRKGEAFASCGLAAIYALCRRFDDAIRCYQHGLLILREVNDLASLSETVVDIGSVRLTQGQLEDAATRATEAVQLSRQCGSQRNEARALAILGHVHRQHEDLDQARDCWRNAGAMFAELGHPQANEVAADLRALEADASSGHPLASTSVHTKP